MQRRVSFSSKQKYFWKVVYVEYYSYLGCVRLRNLDLDFKIRRWDICFYFHLYRSVGKSEKGFEKLSLRTAVLHAHAYLEKGRPLFTRIVVQILFRISQSNGKRKSMKSGFGFLNWNPPWGRISRRWNPFSDFAFDWEIRI